MAGQQEQPGTMNLSEYLEKKRQLVELALQTVLPSEETKPVILHQAMRYSVFSGGKRLRPILTLATAECLGVRAETVINPALAVEILHTYTLIHDDLPCMDDDDERRGKPTSHKVYGEANAILAGDALQSLAFELASQSPISAGLVVFELAMASGSLGVVGGQVADITAGESLAQDEIEFIHQHKTADLFCAAIRMGALASGASEKQLEVLIVYAINIGRAFQIIDDILDADDPTDNSCSCIGIYGIDGAREIARSFTNDAITAISQFGESATALIAIAEKMLARTF